jgi:hypothetical protein
MCDGLIVQTSQELHCCRDNLAKASQPTNSKLFPLSQRRVDRKDEQEVRPPVIRHVQLTGGTAPNRSGRAEMHASESSMSHPGKVVMAISSGK